MSLAITELAAFAERLADTSGPIARGYFRSGLNIDIKADDSPVTRADREVEAHLREIIATTYPDHGIIGEEHGSTGADREYVWILDPIDGTKGFMTGQGYVSKPPIGRVSNLARTHPASSLALELRSVCRCRAASACVPHAAEGRARVAALLILRGWPWLLYQSASRWSMLQASHWSGSWACRRRRSALRSWPLSRAMG